MPSDGADVESGGMDDELRFRREHVSNAVQDPAAPVPHPSDLVPPAPAAQFVVIRVLGDPFEERPRAVLILKKTQGMNAQPEA